MTDLAAKRAFVLAAFVEAASRVEYKQLVAGGGVTTLGADMTISFDGLALQHGQMISAFNPVHSLSP